MLFRLVLQKEKLKTLVQSYIIFFLIILLNTKFSKEEKKDLLLLWTMVGGRVNNL